MGVGVGVGVGVGAGFGDGGLGGGDCIGDDGGGLGGLGGGGGVFAAAKLYRTGGIVVVAATAAMLAAVQACKTLDAEKSCGNDATCCVVKKPCTACTYNGAGVMPSPTVTALEPPETTEVIVTGTVVLQRMAKVDAKKLLSSVPCVDMNVLVV